MILKERKFEVWRQEKKEKKKHEQTSMKVFYPNNYFDMSTVKEIKFDVCIFF